MSHRTWKRDFIYVRADRSKKWTQLTIKKTKIKWFRIKVIISGNGMKTLLILIWFIKKFTILLLKNFANIHNLRLIVSIFAPKFMIQNILKDSLTITTSENQILRQFESNEFCSLGWNGGLNSNAQKLSAVDITSRHRCLVYF